MKWIFLVTCLCVGNVSFSADMNMDDNPFLYRMLVDELEYRDSENSESVSFDADFWAGKDLHKAWLKTEFEKTKGSSENIEFQFLYSRAVTAFWDLQTGIKADIGKQADRQWLVFGAMGIAPYFFEIDAALLVGEHGRVGLNIESEYELLLTQRLILTPELEISVFADDDMELASQSGLNSIELGLRLRYEIKREFAPYIGINWINEKGEPDDMQFLIGIRAWM
jgi:copper resistance protein B